MSFLLCAICIIGTDDSTFRGLVKNKEKEFDGEKNTLFSYFSSLGDVLRSFSHQNNILHMYRQSKERQVVLKADELMSTMSGWIKRKQ